MELQYNELEFNEEEINVLVKRLNDLHKNQQSDFANLSYTIYKIDCWFVDNTDIVLKSKTNDYYDRKTLFKQLGFSNKQVRRYINCYQKYMTLDAGGSKLKDVFKRFSESKLFEMLPVNNETLFGYINSGDLKPTMTKKEIRAFLKSKSEESLESENVKEDVKIASNDKFLVLKNDQARKDFLENYLSWGLWFEEPRLKLKYYRCKIGEKILVAICSHSGYSYRSDYSDVVSYHYLNEEGTMRLYLETEKNLIADMKLEKDKRVYLLD